MAERAQAYVAGPLRRGREQRERIRRDAELLEEVMVDYGKDVIAETVRIFDQAEDVAHGPRVIDTDSVLHLAVNAKAHVAFPFLPAARRHFLLGRQPVRILAVQ